MKYLVLILLMINCNKSNIDESYKIKESINIGGKEVNLSKSYKKIENDSINLNFLIVEKDDSIISSFNYTKNLKYPKPIKLINYINDVQQNKDTILGKQENLYNIEEIFGIQLNTNHQKLNLTKSENELFYSKGQMIENKGFYIQNILSNEDFYSPIELLYLYKSLYSGNLLNNELPIFNNIQLMRIKTTMRKFNLIKGFNNDSVLYYYGIDASNIILMGKKENQYFICEFSIDPKDDYKNRIKSVQSKYNQISNLIK